MRTPAHISAQAETDEKLRTAAETATAEKELAAEEVVTSQAVGKATATPVGQALDIEQGMGG
jgi:ribosomal protein L18